MKIREKSKLNRVIYAFIFLFYVLLTGAYLPAGETAGNTGKYGDAIKKFEDFVKERMVFDRAVGLSVGFMKDDFTWAKGFGYADLENKTPARAESSYRMASITKTFTAIAVLQLVEKGKINLDAEVQEYVPYFPKKKWPVTVRLLLGHLGGISHYRNFDKEGHIKVHKNTKEALAIFQDFDLVAEPGTKYSYSSYGYNLLGAVVEGVSGQSFGDYIKENIFKPLGMENSRMDDPVDVIPFRVRGYRIIKNQIKNSEYVDMSSRFAGGGTRSTVKDMLKYARGVISNKLLKEKTSRMMFTSMATREGFLTRYGMGWAIAPWNGHFRVSHSGSQQETRTYLLIFPKVNFAVAIGANLERIDLFPYVTRLAECVLEEDLDTSAYAPGKEMENMMTALYRTFSVGLGYYKWQHVPLTDDEQELKDAFAYFNRHVDFRALKKNYKETKKKLDAGIHPISKQVFTKIGSFMAAALKEAYGEDALSSYHKKGPFAFFSDFIKLSRQWTGQKKALTFSGSFAKTLSRWEKDWNNTYTGEARDLVIMPGMDFNKTGAHLKNIFARGYGAQIN
jgi:CubicO group peptidase (beta-lactamase class C family)